MVVSRVSIDEGEVKGSQLCHLLKFDSHCVHRKTYSTLSAMGLHLQLYRLWVYTHNFISHVSRPTALSAMGWHL